MRCLCCGKILRKDNGTGWHSSCIQRFFGTKEIPEIDFDEKTLQVLAEKTTSKGYTVPGVQKKISLHLMVDHTQYRLTSVDYPTGYILKPQVDEYEALPESEHLIMTMAEVAGIQTVPHALIKDRKKLSYITKRIDRHIQEDKIEMFGMEDFCQLDHRLTEDKYRGSYERCAEVIKKYSSQIQLDLTELYMRLIFSYLVGNSDMHLKNFSLIETGEGSGVYKLSPAYDLLPVNAIIPADTEEFAIPMNGKKRNIRKKDFIVFAQRCGIEKKTAERMIAKQIKLVPQWIAMCQESVVPNDLKQRIIDILNKRSEKLL